MKKYLFVITVFFIYLNCSFAQTVNEQKFKIHIKKAQNKIKIDGILDEADWQIAQPTPAFNQQFPYDTSLAVQQTQAKVTFDDENFYFSFVVYQPREYRVQSLKRDFPQGGGTDLVFVNIDTFKDKQNAFHFAVNPYGVQREGLIANGNNISNDWDNKWYSAVKNYDDRWVVECAIPFKSLRYKVADNGKTEWNVQFFRSNLFINERSSWATMPRSARGNDIAYSGTMVWDDAPPKPGANIVLIPYSIASLGQDYINEKPLSKSANIGFDAKIGITPSLNLDLTVNPDFSQVEVDRQVTNLSRFEIQFPERRQFFIENNDLFGTFGTNNISPFFSRRIGIARNPISGTTEQTKILGGLRISGKLTNKLRVGLMNMQTNQRTYDENQGLAAANYTVLALQRQLFTRSNVSFLFVNKANALSKLDSKATDTLQFHRIVGVDYNMGSKNGFWRNKFFYHQAFTPNQLVGQNAAGILLNKDSPTWSLNIGNTYVGQNYSAQVGYVPRQNFIRNETNINYTFYPKSESINKHINNFSVGIDWDYFSRFTDGKVIDYDFTPFVLSVQFRNNSSFTIFPWRTLYTYLFSDFDPTNTDGKMLAKDTKYNYKQTRFFYQSNTNNLFYYSFSGRTGQYFNGKLTSITATANYRFIPYVLLSLDATYTQISLPKSYNSTKLWLVSPRAEVTFSKSVFWTTFVQYNNQANNVNINSRFQWRFKPVSDLFIVYTDNYFATATDPDRPYMLGYLGSKNRALVVKLTYWFNV